MWRISSKHDLQDGREIVAYLSCDRVQNGGQADISKGCKDVHEVHLKQLTDALVDKRCWLETSADLHASVPSCTG